jgi:hypothetical protein
MQSREREAEVVPYRLVGGYPPLSVEMGAGGATSPRPAPWGGAESGLLIPVLLVASPPCLAAVPVGPPVPCLAAALVADGGPPRRPHSVLLAEPSKGRVEDGGDDDLRERGVETVRETEGRVGWEGGFENNC